MTLNQLGLHKWCYVLFYLYTSPDHLRYNEMLFRKLNITMSHAKSVLGIFKELGWISCYKKAKNNKVKFIELTEEGVAIAQDLYPFFQRLREKKLLSEDLECLFFPVSEKMWKKQE